MFSAALSKSLLPLAGGERWPIGRMRRLFAGSDAINCLTALGDTPGPNASYRSESCGSLTLFACLKHACTVRARN